MPSTFPILTPLYFSGAPTSRPFTLSEKNDIKFSVLEKNYAAPKTITAATAIMEAAMTNIPMAAGLILFFILSLFFKRVHPAVQKYSDVFGAGF